MHLLFFVGCFSGDGEPLSAGSGVRFLQQWGALRHQVHGDLRPGEELPNRCVGQPHSVPTAIVRNTTRSSSLLPTPTGRLQTFVLLFSCSRSVVQLLCIQTFCTILDGIWMDSCRCLVSPAGLEEMLNHVVLSNARLSKTSFTIIKKTSSHTVGPNWCFFSFWIKLKNSV